MIKASKREEIKKSTSYKLVHYIAKWMDTFFLDPVIGLVMPGLGDVLTSVFAAPYLYLCLVKIRSIPLTLAIIYNILVDVLIGLFPYIGVIGDIFKRAFSKNASLIEGYVEGNKKIIQEIDRKAIGMSFLIVLLCILIYAMIRMTVAIAEWMFSWF